MTRHPDDAFIFELDLDKNSNMKYDPETGAWKFTDRAKEAQAANERLFKTFGPMKALAKRHIASETHEPACVAYGWAYTRSFLRAYAERYQLAVSCRPFFCKVIGKDELVYGQLSEEDAKNPSILQFLDDVLEVTVWQDIEELANIELQRVRPFTEKYDGMFALYTNYDIRERYAKIDAAVDIDDVFRLMQEVFTECGHESELLWWYDSSKLNVDLNSPY
ncbi:hypothetical protein C8Q80DRAFT_1124910 [Daedaleopsis nitida]|nr:hypothetical protein C8Q80DRAFT_1124910 [Daedaleopsis nitida]